MNPENEKVNEQAEAEAAAEVEAETAELTETAEEAAEAVEEATDAVEETAETTEETVETVEESTEAVEEAAEATEEAVEETAEPAEVPELILEAVEEPAEPAQVKKSLSKGAKLGIILGAAVVLLAALATGVFFFLKAHPELTTPKVETVYGDTAYLPEDSAFGQSALTDRERYDIANTTADSLAMRTAVARDTDGGYYLTNGEIQVAYWMEFYQMIQNYGSYASMLGLDTTKPLHEQASLLEGNSWEQYFLGSVVKNTGEFRALQRAAEAEGYALPEDVAAQLDDLANPDGELAASAKASGFASLEDYLRESFGPGVTPKNYQNYMRLYITAMYYYQDVLYGEPYNTSTESEVEAYFDANAESYAADGVTKDSNVDVRHILIMPDGEKAADGTYSEDAWAAAEAEADRIYALWQENQSEDYFSELAKEYSKDGSATNGGAYEAAPGKTVTEFNDWCFDGSRKAGDTGIIRSQYGYHIMYFIGKNDTRAWFDTAKQDLAAQLASDRLSEICETYTVEFDYSHVSIFDMVTYANEQSAASSAASESTEPSESADESESGGESTASPEG